MNKQGPPPPGFAPPPPYHDGMHPPPPHGGPNVLVMHTTQYGPDPQATTCPHCQASMTTRVETNATSKTHLIALLLCLIGCCPCAACIYCADSCLAKKHYCSNCNKYLGMYDA